ncbi:MAG: hypothetical protein OEW37_05265 [Rhodospirillaceae bacterium]|nr:hypothetical protein [Rhodospirillaceae bacterium]
MTTPPLYIMLCSADRDKIQMAGMAASVGAVSDRKVHLFVSMGAIKAFKTGLPASDRYQPSPFSKELQSAGVPDPLELLKQGKMLGEMQVHACSMVIDVLGWEMESLEEGLFDGVMGLTKFLSDAEQGQLITL